MSGHARIWLLLGTRRGDNNQLLALGEALGLPFETRTLTYRWFSRPWMALFATGTGHLSPASRATLTPPWPDLVIGIGRRSVPVARWIRSRSGGAARLVRLGHPRADSRLFDLVLTTRQYPVPEGENVVHLPLALNRFRNAPEPTAAERALLAALPRPHLLLSLGGTAPMWKLDLATLDHALESLSARASRLGGSLLVVRSPRTNREALDRVRLHRHATLIDDGSVRYPVALADADEQFVTADSVSMISEAVMSGKPVGLVPVTPDARGARVFAAEPSETKVRDIRRFWLELGRDGLVGTIEKPTAGRFEDPVELAVRAIRDRLGGLLA